MTVRKWSVALAVLSLFAPCPLSATAEVLWTDGKPAKANKQLEVQTEDRNQESAPALVWVVNEGYKPGSDPKGQAEEPTVLPFFKACFWVASDPNEQGPDQRYLLASEINPGARTVKEYIGWVPKKFVLFSKEADKDPATKIYRKGLIVNSIASIKAKNDPFKVEFRQAPVASAAKDDKPNRLYEVFFEYKEADGFVLLGTEPTFLVEGGTAPKGEKDGKRVMLGWLPRTRVESWTTREGFDWDSASTLRTAKDRRVIPGRIYETQEKAIEALKNPNSAIDYLVTEPRDENGEYPPLPHNVLRYPVLQKGKKVEDAATGRSGQLLTVGAIGALVDEKGNPLLSMKDSGILKAKAEAWAQVTKKTEILFIIDDTLSAEEVIRKWLEVLGGEIEKIAVEAVETKGIEVRMAVAYYNDHDKPDRFPGPDGQRPGPTLVRPLKRIESVAEAKKLAAEVASHKVFGGGDPHEMLYRGIIEAIDGANFSSHARKMVVVLGDAGDITALPKRMEADPEYAKKYNPDQILRRLIPEKSSNGTPIEFYAIHTELPTARADAAPGNDPFLDFKVQMEAISKGYAERMKQVGEKGTGVAEYFPRNSYDQAAKKITRQYGSLKEAALSVGKQWENIGKGDFRSNVSPEVAARVNAELKKLDPNMTLEKLAQSAQGQVFEKGYVWLKTHDGIDQINEQLWINDGELKSVCDILKVIEDAYKAKDNPTLIDVLGPIIAKQVGDNKDLNSVSDIMQKQTGIVFLSTILNENKVDLAQRKDKRVNRNEFMYLKMMRELLDGIYNGQNFEFEKVEVINMGDKSIEYNKIPKGRLERGYNREGEKLQRWFWLEISKEWP